MGIDEFGVENSKKGGGLGDWRVYNGTPVLSPNEVPVPAAVWLFGSALAGLLGMGRKMKLATA